MPQDRDVLVLGWAGPAPATLPLTTRELDHLGRAYGAACCSGRHMDEDDICTGVTIPTCGILFGCLRFENKTTKQLSWADTMSPEGSSHQMSHVPAKEWNDCVLPIPSVPSVAVVSIPVQQVHTRLRCHVNMLSTLSLWVPLPYLLTK